jgi:hypothetical protein
VLSRFSLFIDFVSPTPQALIMMKASVFSLAFAAFIAAQDFSEIPQCAVCLFLTTTVALICLLLT